MNDREERPPGGAAAAAAENPSLRLQELISGWRGTDRGEPLEALHRQCVDALGPGLQSLIPARLLPIHDLDLATLETATRRLSRLGSTTRVRFRVPPTGRFDSALVPVGSTETGSNRWLLAIDENLSGRDQVALYAHAVGHLLLNHEERAMGRWVQMDPRSGYSHADKIAELRQFETVRNLLDRRVLEAYPLLQALLTDREEAPVMLAAAAEELRQRLVDWGWRGNFELPHAFTNGRVFVSGSRTRRGPRLRADAILRVVPSLPVALVQTRRAGESLEDAEYRLVDYAHTRMALPFGYLVDGQAVHEFDWSASGEPARSTSDRVPEREALWHRLIAAVGLEDERAQDALRYPYQVSQGRPRYYQEAAINRAIIAVLQAKRGQRRPRILLTMATGTGKTKVAFQIAWKLKRTRAVRNMLYITDRDYLLGQAMDHEFAPFADARARIRGEAGTARDVLFATYHALADDRAREGLFRDYPPDFFDLVVVDECHRGSAGDESNWRRILEHFSDAVQLGMTATPRRDANVQTYDYFGEPLYTYKLRDGINDGFLAPYRVRRVIMGDSSSGGSTEIVDDEPTDHDASCVLGSTDTAHEEESAASLRERTDVVAGHLANHLHKTNSLAKTIVFCVDQPHADDMRAALERECADEVGRYADYVERIVSDEGADGRRALGRFSDPGRRTPVVVTTSKLLSTGVDVPTCQNIVLAKPIQNMVEFKQIIGRGTRLYEPDKTWFSILDYSGATQRFFDPDFDGDPEIIEVEPLVPQPHASESDGGEIVPASADEVGAAETVGAPVLVGTGGIRASSSDSSDELAPGEGTSGGLGPPQTTESSKEPTDHPAPDPVPDRPVDAHPPAEGTAVVHTHGDGSGTDTAPPPAPSGPTRPPQVPPEGGRELVRSRDGRVIRVVGEILWELGPDGQTLRQVSYREYARDALTEFAANPIELRARWLQKEYRAEIQERLAQEGVDLEALAESLELPEADPLDLLLHVAFGTPAPTRRERVERVRSAHPDFFAQFGGPARAILDTILEKYVAGEAPDVSDPELLKVPPLSEAGTFIELATRFGGGARVRGALRELNELLYSA